jgi:hypothetical protein
MVECVRRSADSIIAFLNDRFRDDRSSGERDALVK